jgi:hypothetical protein
MNAYLPAAGPSLRLGFVTCALAVVLGGCATRMPHLAEGPLQTLTIRWQRLVDASDETCPRCATTEEEVQRALGHLKRSLAPVGIDVRLETERIDEAAFRKAPLESNRIWVGERPLEEWLGARTASSPCCDACAGAECRTVSVGAETYEAIPAALIVRAGFVAAGELLRQDSTGSSLADSTWTWSPFECR